jgi:anti-sigma factor RsiW
MRGQADEGDNPMKCSPELVEAYLDAELDAAHHAAVEEHMVGCPTCFEAHARLHRQKAGIQGAPYYKAPPELHRSVRNALRRAAAEEDKPRAYEAPRRWPAIAASLLLAMSLAWNLVQHRSREAQVDMAGSVVAAHIRSLLGSHLVDVASSDQHTVKPWFAGKLDFSPEVKDLQAEGFPLAGGRIDYLAGRRVAALIYHRRQHVINLFIWPGVSSSGSAGGASHDGYNLLRWTGGGITYWAVSDVSPEELENLRTLLR